MSQSRPDPSSGLLPRLARIGQNAVYGAVGLAVTGLENAPGLVSKGQRELDNRVRLARTIGSFFIGQAERGIGRVISSRIGPRDTGAGHAGQARPQRAGNEASKHPARAAGVSEPASATKASSDPVGGPSGSTRRSGTSSRRRASPAASEPKVGDSFPDVTQLAIPEYDSLSAMQVVRRLAGLNSSELSAVAKYEAATRGRRTILAKVGQLQNASVTPPVEGND